MYGYRKQVEIMTVKKNIDRVGGWERANVSVGAMFGVVLLTSKVTETQPHVAFIFIFDFVIESVITSGKL